MYTRTSPATDWRPTLAPLSFSFTSFPSLVARIYGQATERAAGADPSDCCCHSIASTTVHDRQSSPSTPHNLARRTLHRLAAVSYDRPVIHVRRRDSHEREATAPARRAPRSGNIPRVETDFAPRPRIGLPNRNMRRKRGGRRYCASVAADCVCNVWRFTDGAPTRRNSATLTWVGSSPSRERPSTRVETFLLIFSDIRSIDRGTGRLAR